MTIFRRRLLYRKAQLAGSIQAPDLCHSLDSLASIHLSIIVVSHRCLSHKATIMARRTCQASHLRCRISLFRRLPHCLSSLRLSRRTKMGSWPFRDRHLRCPRLRHCSSRLSLLRNGDLVCHRHLSHISNSSRHSSRCLRHLRLRASLRTCSTSRRLMDSLSRVLRGRGNYTIRARRRGRRNTFLLLPPNKVDIPRLSPRGLDTTMDNDPGMLLASSLHRISRGICSRHASNIARILASSVSRTNCYRRFHYRPFSNAPRCNSRLSPYMSIYSSHIPHTPTAHARTLHSHCMQSSLDV